MSMVGLAKVILINIFFIAITLGLYLPAAKVRMTKYIASSITMQIAGSLDSFEADESQEVGAMGKNWAKYSKLVFN